MLCGFQAYKKLSMKFGLKGFFAKYRKMVFLVT